MPSPYVHGYHARESARLHDQATTLVDLLHADTRYGAGERVLEVGCGVGAQTVTLARNSPEAKFLAIDVSEASLLQARKTIDGAGLTNVVFERGNLLELPFADGAFDHLFVCFVLEHLPAPIDALTKLRRLVRVGGTITVIEGDHGSTFFHPDSHPARRAIDCQVELQRRAGGNANLGRQLFPLLKAAGYGAISVSPRMVYVDASRPEWVEGFTKRTFTAMIQAVRPAALAAKLMEPADFDQGIADLERTTAPDGVFCYTFFKAIGVHEGAA